MLAHREPTDSHASHQSLVPGESKDVDVHLFHVNGNDACRLGGIYDKGEVVLATDCPDLLDRLDRADDI